MYKRQIIITLLILLILPLTACGSSSPDPLTIDQAIQAFHDAGLECEDPQPEEKDPSKPRPNTFTDGIRCIAPSVDEDHGIRILSFETQEDLQPVQDYYEGFTGLFASYVFTRDNLLFQTSATMPKELSEQYRETFETFTP